MARAMTHAENAYFIPNIEIRGTVCRTNMPPNTAFRGFGGPQGVATIENVMEEIAHFLRKDAIEIRKTNCYGVDSRNVTPYGQIVRNNTLPRLFLELTDRSDYSRAHAGRPRFQRDVEDASQRSVDERGEVRDLLQHQVPQPGQRPGQRLPRRNGAGLDRRHGDGPGREHEDPPGRRGRAGRSPSIG